VLGRCEPSASTRAYAAITDIWHGETMGWSSEVYVHYKDGVYYVGVHGGEQECDHLREGTPFHSFEEAMRRAVQLAARGDHSNGIQVYHMDHLLERRTGKAPK
jgi:hypothetical protein